MIFSSRRGCRQIAYVLADRDRNMLVKHNLLDSFGVSGLVLVGFVSGLTKGFYNCHAGSRVGNVLPTCQEPLIINASAK